MSKKRMAAVPFILPPTAEQKRIVDAIEEHFSCLDTADDGVSAAAAKSDALSSTATSQLFLKEWPTRRIGELARVGSGATPKRSEARYWSDGTIPWVTSGAVNQRAIVSPTELITEDALAETVASYRRCNSGTGVGSFNKLSTQEGDLRPCLHEYRPLKLSASRSMSIPPDLGGIV